MNLSVGKGMKMITVFLSSEIRINATYWDVEMARVQFFQGCFLILILERAGCECGCFGKCWCQQPLTGGHSLSTVSDMMATTP